MGINRGAVIGFASMCGPGGAGLVVVDLLQLSGQATARWWLATQRRHKNIERQGGNKTNPLLAKIPMGTRPLYLWWLLLVWGLWRDICRWLSASKTVVTALLTQWSYRSLPLSHRYLVWYVSRTPKMYQSLGHLRSYCELSASNGRHCWYLPVHNDILYLDLKRPWK